MGSPRPGVTTTAGVADQVWEGGRCSLISVNGHRPGIRSTDASLLGGCPRTRQFTIPKNLSPYKSITYICRFWTKIAFSDSLLGVLRVGLDSDRSAGGAFREMLQRRSVNARSEHWIPSPTSPESRRPRGTRSTLRPNLVVHPPPPVVDGHFSAPVSTANDPPAVPIPLHIR